MRGHGHSRTPRQGRHCPSRDSGSSLRDGHFGQMFQSSHRWSHFSLPPPPAPKSLSPSLGAEQHDFGKDKRAPSPPQMCHDQYTHQRRGSVVGKLQCPGVVRNRAGGGVSVYLCVHVSVSECLCVIHKKKKNPVPPPQAQRCQDGARWRLRAPDALRHPATLTGCPLTCSPQPCPPAASGGSDPQQRVCKTKDARKNPLPCGRTYLKLPWKHELPQDIPVPGMRRLCPPSSACPCPHVSQNPESPTCSWQDPTSPILQKCIIK